MIWTTWLTCWMVYRNIKTRRHQNPNRQPNLHIRHLWAKKRKQVNLKVYRISYLSCFNVNLTWWIPLLFCMCFFFLFLFSKNQILEQKNSMTLRLMMRKPIWLMNLAWTVKFPRKTTMCFGPIGKGDGFVFPHNFQHSDWSSLIVFNWYSFSDFCPHPYVIQIFFFLYLRMT